MVVESEVHCTDAGTSKLVSKTTATIVMTQLPQTQPA
jgi:hypothetical protein